MIWQIIKIACSALIGAVLVSVMVKGQQGDVEFARAAGFYGALGFGLLCCVALAWDSVKKIKHRKKNTAE